MAVMILLDLMGGVALLLWGLHMVHSGIVRAFGAGLQRWLRVALGNRLAAFGVGLGVTAILQSSTATALMFSSLAGDGVIDLVPGMAVMLGANVGTTLVVQALSFPVAPLAPLLFLAGLVAFKKGAKSRTRDLGRAAIGIGLMLLALHILMDTLAPAEDAPVARAVFHAITTDPILCVAVAAALTWAVHSSVASVLLIMSLAYSHFVTAEASLGLVLGANLGSAIIPVFEAVRFGDPASRRLPLGNLIIRLAGCAAVLPFLQALAAIFSGWEPNPSRMTADFHTAFNVVLAAAFMAPLGPLGAVLTRVLPKAAPASDPGTPVYLDPSAIAMPKVALSCAAREVMRMGDVVEGMLRQSIMAFQSGDRALVADISRMDNAVDKLDTAVKHYVTRVSREQLDEAEGRRAMEIISFSINLEHIGDIIDKNLMELASKKIRRKLSFSAEGARELEQFHQEVVGNLKLAFGVFLSGDITMARQLIEEKGRLRTLELEAYEMHLARLREGRPESVESSSLHVDVLRDLKRIHSHICTVAYPVLERAGELQESRLRGPGRMPGP